MSHTVRRVLVTVKTYPNPSRKYQETVCVAGVDVETGDWLRLYPIPFRDLKAWQQFRKYSVIEVRVQKSTADTRPESFKVDRDSIKVVEWLDTRQKWAKRRAVVLRRPATSLCALRAAQRATRTSLGVVKPEAVEFTVEPEDVSSREAKRAFYDQTRIFDGAHVPIEPIPYRFVYRFRCADEARCRGHALSIRDWEIMQHYRRMRGQEESESSALAKVRQKWLDELCAEGKDTHFYVGNTMAHPTSFLVLGVFWPPK